MNFASKLWENLSLLIINIVIYYLFPINIKNYLVFATLFCSLAIFLYSLKKFNIALSIVIAVFFCTPSFQIAEADSNIKIRLLYFIYFVIVIFCLENKILFHKKIIKRVANISSLMIVLLVILVSINFLYFIFGLNSDYITSRLLFFRLGAFYTFFYFGYTTRISYNSFIKILTFSLAGILFYVIAQVFFHYTPYSPIAGDGYESVISDNQLANEIRAYGLFGHPLVLSSVACFSFCFYLIQYLLYKKISIIGISMTLIIIILSLSRTPVIIFLLIFLFFLLFSDVLKRKKSLSYFIIIFFIASLSVLFFAQSFLETIIDRFSKIESQNGHRLGAYMTGVNVFSNNILGLGDQDIMKKIRINNYNAPGFWAYFTTMDSFYMTLLSSYGLLSIFHFFYYYIFIFYTKKIKKINLTMRVIHKSIILLYIAFSLIAFSFDLELFPVLLSLFSIGCGLIIKNEIHNHA